MADEMIGFAAGRLGTANAIAIGKPGAAARNEDCCNVQKKTRGVGRSRRPVRPAREFHPKHKPKAAPKGGLFF